MRPKHHLYDHQFMINLDLWSGITWMDHTNLGYRLSRGMRKNMIPSWNTQLFDYMSSYWAADSWHGLILTKHTSNSLGNTLSPGLKPQLCSLRFSISHLWWWVQGRHVLWADSFCFWPQAMTALLGIQYLVHAITDSFSTTYVYQGSTVDATSG